ncbi:MAG TPA: hypothetical protein VFZ58_02680 [Candidatus Saccharimonadales bacterium]
MIQKVRHIIVRLWRRVSLSGAVGIAVVAVVVWLVANSVVAIQMNFQRQVELDSLKQEVALLQLENETAEFQNQYYKTNEYLDLQARKLLGKALPGEKMVVLPLATTVAPLPAEQPVYRTAMQDRSNIEQWFYFLFSDKKEMR